MVPMAVLTNRLSFRRKMFEAGDINENYDVVCSFILPEFMIALTGKQCLLNHLPFRRLIYEVIDVY